MQPFCNLTLTHRFLIPNFFRLPNLVMLQTSFCRSISTLTITPNFSPPDSPTISLRKAIVSHFFSRGSARLLRRANWGNWGCALYAGRFIFIIFYFFLMHLDQEVGGCVSSDLSR